MEEIFITKIKINKVRHLENIEITIDEKERKHLILTGKNGSGKTSVLNYLKQYLAFFQAKDLVSQKLLMLTHKIPDPRKDENPLKKNILVDVANVVNLQDLHEEGNFILCFFDAKRNSNFKEPNGIHKLSLKNSYQLDEKAGNLFLQYIVNLKADRSFARDDKKEDTVRSIDEWFLKFEL